MQETKKNSETRPKRNPSKALSGWFKPALKSHAPTRARMKISTSRKQATHNSVAAYIFSPLSVLPRGW